MSALESVREPDIIIEAREAAEEAGRILTQARGFVITGQSGLEAASLERTRIKQRYNEIEELRKRLKQPVLDAARNIDDQFRQPLAELTDAVQVIDQAVKAYVAEQARLRAAEEQRLREEAARERERLQREAAVEAAKAEALRRQAAEAAERGSLETAARLNARADQADARSDARDDAVHHVAVPVVPEAPVKVAGLSTRERWAFRVTDASKLPREYLMPDESAIRAVVNGLKGNTRIPGVEVYRDDTVTGRARR